jgi:hypothetical protein
MTALAYETRGHGAIPVVVTVPDGARAGLLTTMEWLQRSRQSLRGTLRRGGAVLLRGLPVESPAEVAAVREAISGQPASPREPFAGRDYLGHGVYSDVHWPPDRMLCPQHEQSYRLEFPQLVLLACLRPAETGGEALLADGREVLARLPAPLAGRLHHHGWIMIRNFRDRFGVPWREAFDVADRDSLEAKLSQELIRYRWGGDGSLWTARRRSAVVHHPVDGRPCWFNHAAFFNEWGLSLDPAEREVLHEAFGPSGLTLNTRIGNGEPFTPDEVAAIEKVYDELSVPVGLGRGDLLLLDNIAVAHGRRPYTGEREVAVAMGEPVTLASCRPTVEPAATLPAGTC